MAFSLSFIRFIHPQLHHIVAKMTLFDTLLFFVIHLVDKVGLWHRLPVLLGLAYLGIRRHLHQRYNLVHVGSKYGQKYDADQFIHRTADGTYNDPTDHLIGSYGSYFGRNMPPSSSSFDAMNCGAPGPPAQYCPLWTGARTTLFLGYAQNALFLLGTRNSFFMNHPQFPPLSDVRIGYPLRNRQVMDPHPSLVATKLLERRKFIDNGKQFDMIACSWIQFMIHDWIDHLEDTKQVEVEAPTEVANGCPLKSFKFKKTKIVPTGSPFLKTGSLNTRTPWWDGSVIYGNNKEGENKVRTFKDGKLRLAGDGLLEHDRKGIPISGDVRNCWAGFSLLQALFVKEHNAVCDMLKVNYPVFDDERLYRHARLVTSAVIAKIHTIDWTVELLKTDSLLAGMRINWYGFLGKRFKDKFGHICGPIFSGLVGLRKPRDHGVPYSLTEEFVSVYRMHSLLPDELILRDINPTFSDHTCPPVLEEVPLKELIGKEGERRLSKIGMEQMLVSMGHQGCGALSLRNYPTWMRNLVAHDVNGEDRTDLVDMAAMEIYRDRERGVARYNEFRRNLLMIPISRWEDLTNDDEEIEALREVYGDDVEKLDLLVGLHAEKKIKGFAISETAFFIFLLVASRRLEADRFFTTNFDSRSYTEKGLEWVNKTETLKDVIERHFPEMCSKWMKCPSAFSVWSSKPNPKTYLPLYLRTAP